MTLRKGTRVMIIDTQEIGTIAEKQIVTLHGQRCISCRIVTQKHPGGIWMPRERFRDPVETATVTIVGDDGTMHEINVRFDNDGRKLELSTPGNKGLFVDGRALADFCSHWFLSGVATFIKPTGGATPPPLDP